jgi:DICT domain-containing protein
MYNIALKNENAMPGKPDLSQNWFVILDSPELVSMALVARELPANSRPRSAPNSLLYRNFEGFWTYNREIISQTVAVLEDYIRQQAPDSPYPN